MPATLSMEAIATLAALGIILILCIVLFRKVIGCFLRLVLNTICGFVLLFALNFLGGFIGISLGINWFNAIVVGIFGLPGVGLLLILQWLLIV